MCIFCKIINKEIPSSIVYEDEDVLAILDLSQVTLGHTLVMPKKHVKNLLEADSKTVSSVMEVVRQLADEITQKTQAKGCNILMNCNEVAGQTVDHMHVHIIPRYHKQEAITIEFKESEKQNLDAVLNIIKSKEIV